MAVCSPRAAGACAGALTLLAVLGLSASPVTTQELAVSGAVRDAEAPVTNSTGTGDVAARLAATGSAGSSPTRRTTS